MFDFALVIYDFFQWNLNQCSETLKTHFAKKRKEEGKRKAKDLSFPRRTICLGLEIESVYQVAVRLA